MKVCQSFFIGKSSFVHLCSKQFYAVGDIGSPTGVASNFYITKNSGCPEFLAVVIFSAPFSSVNPYSYIIVNLEKYESYC